eukprot:172772-Rhodomonas_salina.14
MKSHFMLLFVLLGVCVCNGSILPDDIPAMSTTLKLPYSTSSTATPTPTPVITLPNGLSTGTTQMTVPVSLASAVPTNPVPTPKAFSDGLPVAYPVVDSTRRFRL